MEIFFTEALDRIELLHRELAKAIDGLPVAGLDWSPASDVPSLAVLIAHVTGSERFWLGDVALEDPSHRDRESEFLTRGQDGPALQARLDAAQAYARQALDRLSSSDLEKKHLASRDGRTVTAAWAILHVLEHTGIHVGHAQLIRQLWEMQPH